MAKLIAIVLMGFLLAGCSGGWFEKVTSAGGDFCDVAQPHVHSSQAQRAMNDAELATETSHNEYGEKKCGWKPQKR